MVEALFDNIKRSETRPMRLTGSLFAYYNASARPFIAAMRAVQEQWFSDFPIGEAKEDLRRRFRSESNSQHRGAQFELFIHALVRAMGFELVPHPEIKGGKGGRPDFLVLRDGTRLFYIEATIAEPSQRREAQYRGTAQIQEAINEISSPNFLIDIEIERASGQLPNLRSLKGAAEGLVTPLDPDKVERAISNGREDEVPTLAWKDDGWEILLRPRPRSRQRRGIPGGQTCGVVITPITLMDTEERIRAAVRGKAKCYGELHLPLVVAVNVIEDAVDDIDLMEGLFGKEVWTVDPTEANPVARLAGRSPDGAWFRPDGLKNKRVSAVFICDRMSPGDVFHRKAVLVHHPVATHPFRKEWWATSQLIADQANHRLEPLEGRSPGEILGLPTPWPPTSE